VSAARTRHALALCNCLVALAFACSGGSDGSGPGADEGGAPIPADAAPSSDGDDAPETATSPPLPFGVNALLLPDADAPIPLYTLASAAGAVRAVAYRYDGSTLEAIDQDANSIWKRVVGSGALFGGFDLDGDGWPDFGLARTTPNGQTCGASAMNDTSLDLGLGKDGTTFPRVVGPLSDICWTFGTTTYPTLQWTALGVLFGASSSDVVLVPQYTSTNANARNAYNEGKAYAMGLRGGAVVKLGELTMPTVPAYDAFAAAKLEPHGTGTKYYAASHVPNGLLVATKAAPELLFFTSGRVVAYREGAPFDLVSDYPYLTGGRTDLVGRNYGLVMPDPAAPYLTAIVTGTPAVTLFQDMTSGAMTADPWAGIERHVSVHDARTNTLVDRFFSYAHDNNDGMQYEGRTSFANSAWIASRLLFDVYEGGHWHTIVTAPGDVTTALDVQDLFVWDARDLDGDGTIDIVASPARDPSDPDVPGYYFVKWRTLLMHWDEPTKTLVTTRTIEGAIPWLVGSFREPARTSSVGFLYPSLTVARDEKAQLVLRKPDATRLLAPL
jgi:hypothetical protein